jgi:hypothetical protein
MSWNIKIEKWDQIDSKTAALMLSQCETKLKETAETAKTISAKSEKLISIFIPIATVLVVYIITGNHNSMLLYLSACISLIPCCFGIFLCLRNMLKYTVNVPGVMPSEIFKSELIENDLNHDQKYLSVVYGLAENFQSGIKENIINNSNRIKNNDYSIYCIISLILSPLLSKIILLISTHHF